MEISIGRKARPPFAVELETKRIEFLSGDAPGVRLHPKGRK